MRILLINPLYRHFPGHTGMDGYAEPPIGLAYLAAYLRANGFPEVQIIDNCAQNLSKNALLEKIVAMRPDVVGFYSSTITINRVGELAAKIKERLPHAKIIVGGPHISVLPDDLPPVCDAAVLREGEESLLALLGAFTNGKNIAGIAGTASRNDDGTIVVAPEREMIRAIDNLPFPAWDLLCDRDYIYQYPTPSRSAGFRAVLCSRGCPFNCSFCAKSAVWGRTVRRRSVDNVLEELKKTLADHIDLVFFRDDTFNHDRNWLDRLLLGIQTLPAPLHWSCLVRADMLDRNQAKKMADAGCFEIQTGVETGNKDTLSQEKKTELHKFTEGIAFAREANIRVKATFILGLPGENEQMVRNTIRTAIEIKPDYAFFASFIPFPGTAYYSPYRQKGFFTTTDYNRFNYHGYPIINTPELNSATRYRLRKCAYRTFYLRPLRIVRFAWATLRSGRFGAAKRALAGFLNLTRSQNEMTASDTLPA